MHRNDNSSNVATLPTPEAVGTPGYFSKGTAGVNDATIPGQDWFNMIQEELVNVIIEAGDTPDQTKVDFTQLAAAIKKLGVAVGTVFPFAASTLPDGYLKANGAAISRTTYSSLFAIIGTVFGVGDGSSTFNLPDLRGEFIRGWDDARGIDSGRGFGSWQADDFKSHVHSVPEGSYIGGGSGVYTSGDDRTNNVLNYNNSLATGGIETKPRNLSLLYIIKY